MILVTGGSGQVAQALTAGAGARSVRVVGRPKFDFDAPDGMIDVLREARPALVVNTAAYTSVDQAEDEPEAADRANHLGPGLIARFCADSGIPLIHLSTDYVFDGQKGAPYVETDLATPVGAYGASKLAGEQAVLAAGGRAMVLRPSWVYSAVSKNFVLTMLNAAKKTDTLRVVVDQIGCPTSADDLAAAIFAIADHVGAEWDARYGGVFHACGTGATSWHSLAEAVFERAAIHGLTPPTVIPIATADWRAKVTRPPDSRLDTGKLADVFGVCLPEWRGALTKVVDAVFAREAAVRRR